MNIVALEFAINTVHLATPKAALSKACRLVGVELQYQRGYPIADVTDEIQRSVLR
jgi:hypothetical protein